jgi:hypothetical protein
VTTWRRHFFYEKKSIRTTWKLRIGALIVVILIWAATSGFWTAKIARSLVCARDVAPSDVILIENFDPNYLLFERAAALEQAGLARRALVPVQIHQPPSGPPAINAVSQGIAEVMARQARIGVWGVIPIRAAEPVSLNAAAQIREYLAREQVKSLIVVTTGFRSRRSFLIYHAVLNGSDVQVRCDPVFGLTTPERWTDTWHGIQEVAEQFLKLQYYRFYVLPFLFRVHDAATV